MKYFLDAVKRTIDCTRAVFRENPLFGIIFLGLLGTALLFSPFGGTYFEAIKYPWAVSVLGAYALYFSVYGKVVRWSWYGCVCALLVGWALIAALLSPSPVVALIGHFPRYNSSVLLFAFFVATIWASAEVVRAGKARLIVNGLLAVGGFAAVFAVLQSFGFASYTGVESLFSPTPGRVSSLLGNPNFSALFLSGMIPFAVGLMFEAQSRRARWVAVTHVFVLVWAVALFASRGAILAMAIGIVPLAAWLFWKRRWVQGIVLVLAIFLSTWIFSGTFLLYRGQEAAVLVSAQDSSAVDRYVAWDVARDIIVTHPWFGYGPASFQQYYWEHLPSGLMAEGLYFDDAHNTLLQITTAVGIPGLLLFSLVIALAVAQGVRVLRKETDGTTEWIVVAAVGTVGAWVVGSSFNPVTPALYMQLALILGLLYGLGKQHGRTVSVPLEPVGVYAVRGMGIVLIAYGLCMIVGNQLFIVATRYHAAQQFSKSYQYSRIATHIDPLSPLLQVARVATMQSAGVPLPEVRSAVQRLMGASWATSPRIALQLADIAGQVYIESGASEDQVLVEQALSMARMHGPTYPDAYVQSAFYAANFGRADEAVLYAQRGVLLQPKNYLTWLVMAKAYQAAGNYEGLVLAMQKAQSLRPHDKLLPVLKRRLQETGDPRSINLLPQKTFVLLSLQ